MQIRSAQVALGGERVALRHSRVEERLQATLARGGTRIDIASERRSESASIEFSSYGELARTRRNPAPEPIGPPAFRPLALSLAPPAAFSRPIAAPAVSAPAVAAQPASAAVPADGELLLLELLIEILSGREIEVARVEVAAPSTAAIPVSAPAGQFSLDYSYSAYYLETEQTSFRATGIVETADGRRIAFDLQVEMARRFESSVAFELHLGQRKDPLVLDLDGGAVQLDAARMAFDLDGDGRSEQVALPTGGSVLLALDLDGNGRVSDGGELFGALGGDGFADLARHDSDGNGWIDAADPVFARLLAWRRRDGGGDSLQSLASLGVGALWLGNVATPFELRGPGNEALGAVRQSGLYLNEDGSAGALQQLDLVV